MKICAICNQEYDKSFNNCPDDGGSLEEDPLIHTTLDGQYNIEARIGKGGMGVVYRAQHVMTKEMRAIKVLSPEVSNVPNIKARFLREGRAAHRIHHQNVITVYDVCTASNGLLYMVMEYIEGNMLSREVMRKRKFSPLKAYFLLENVIDVLGVAHASGVVHRDLKPENIMIGKFSDGALMVKLLDLGIAKLYRGTESTGGSIENLTGQGQALGTPYYMSPEQWGEPPRDTQDGKYDVDGRADLYSIGVIFYELIAGEKPFKGPGLVDLATQHISKTPVPLHELIPEASEGFSKAIARAMEKDRNDRPATAVDFDKELREGLGLPAKTYFTPSGHFVSQSEKPKEEPSADAAKQEKSSINKLVSGVLGLFRRS